MSEFTDIIRLAHRNGGKIPKIIPSHYLTYSFALHRRSRKLAFPRLEKPVPLVIHLPMALKG